MRRAKLDGRGSLLVKKPEGVDAFLKVGKVPLP